MNLKRGQFAIQIGETTLEGHFSMTFLYAYSQFKKCELSEVHTYLSNFDALGFCEIVVCAHIAHCNRTNQTPVYNNAHLLLDDLYEFGLLSNESIIGEVTKALTESVLFQNDENPNTGIKRNVKKTTKDPK